MRRFWVCAFAILAITVSLVPAASAAEPSNTETITVDLTGRLPFFDSPSTGSLTVIRTGNSFATADTWQLNLGLNTSSCTGSGTATEVWNGAGGGLLTLLTKESWSCAIFEPLFPLMLEFTNQGSVVVLLGVPFAVNPPLQAPFTGQTAIGVMRTPEGIPMEFDILHGRFYRQTAARDGRGYGIRDGGQNGGTDAFGNEIPFWSLFRMLGAVDALGYPTSRVFVLGGLYYQATQRGLFQWLPDAKVARPANVLDYLHDQGFDSLLENQYLIPPQVNDPADAKTTRLGALYGGTGDGWLTDPDIKTKFLAAPALNAVSTWSGAYEPRASVTPKTWTIEDAINVYGLPTSMPVDRGAFIVQRFQRGALQKWTADVPGMPAKGTVVGVLSGEIFKSLAGSGLVTGLSSVTGTGQPGVANTIDPEVLETTQS